MPSLIRMTGPGDLISTGELAKRLGFTPRTIQRWRERGWIKPAIVAPRSGRARWIEADVREQLRQVDLTEDGD
jgi:DNA-binding transcriptional MerR regulator